MERDREAFEAAWKEHERLMEQMEHFADRADFGAGWQAALAYVREGVEWKKGSLEEVGTTDRGYTIFREVNEVGGHRYWSDEIGGGVVAWDTCLVDAGTLRECLRIEEDNVSPPEKE